MLPLVTLEGRLAADPEMRFSPSGKAVAQFRVVCADRRYNEADQKWEDSRTLWIDVTAFDKVAENAVESLTKGDEVLMVGKLQTDEWEDRDSGAKRSKITLIANAVGPSLRFRTTPHGAGKAERSSGGSTGSDPWTSGGGAGTPASNSTDEPPF